jgi:hypothetical protein
VRLTLLTLTTTLLLREITEVIRGIENIVDETVTHFTALKRYQDICADSNAPSMFVIPDHPVTKAYQELKEEVYD